MDFEGEVFVDDMDQSDVFVNIRTNQAGFLIGQAGATLNALQYLARILVQKKNGQAVKFLLDINHYRRSRIDLLRQLARDIAKQALLKRVAVTLQPMSAYERRVIHMALCDHPEVNTESIGEGLDRKVVVRPIE